jgi:hypothetical protein
MRYLQVGEDARGGGRLAVIGGTTLTGLSQLPSPLGRSLSGRRLRTGGLSVRGPVTLEGRLQVAEATELQDDLSVSGDTSVRGGLEVSSKMTWGRARVRGGRPRWVGWRRLPARP